MLDRSLLYEKLRWPEIKEAAAQDKFIILPAAMIEDHGPHLPVDTDVVIARGICELTTSKMEGEALLAPAIVYGYSPHHMDFPGPLTITWDTFIRHTLDVLKSLIHHGFRHILVVNGHGSNASCLDMACRLAMVNHDHARCGMVSWWSLSQVAKTFQEIRESPVTSHACEIETSLYLALSPEHVDMTKAPRDLSLPWSDHFWTDLVAGPLHPHKNRVMMTEYWSTLTTTGTVGDASVATAEKGLKVLEVAADEICDILREMKARPWMPRVDHHK
ncbi:MAG: creatininase family protein [Bacillota bacterium]|nr:creatininase family protein [Bacillota bacterium]